MGDTDPDKLEAALEQLETEKARRLQAKIDAGECVSVQTAIVVSARDDDTEAERTRALANLPKTTPDGRAIHHDLFFVVTGVPRADPDEPSPQVQTTAVSEEGSVASPSEEPARSGPLSSSAPTYVSVTISNGDDGGPGRIAEALWSVDDGCVVLTDLDGRHLSGRALLKGQDPAAVARALLREMEKPKDFHRPLVYPKMGLA